MIDEIQNLHFDKEKLKSSNLDINDKYREDYEKILSYSVSILEFVEDLNTHIGNDILISINSVSECTKVFRIFFISNLITSTLSTTLNVLESSNKVILNEYRQFIREKSYFRTGSSTFIHFM